MPTKVPKPDKTPESISPTLWQNVNRRDILSFLDDHSGSYLFYKVMGNDPDPENSRDEEFNAVCSRPPRKTATTRRGACISHR